VAKQRVCSDLSSASQLTNSSKHASCCNLSSSSCSNLNSKLENTEDERLAITGNMFKKREDWSVLYRIPFEKQNMTDIRLEDEGPYGNDETRCFVLSHLSSLKIREIKCCLCNVILPIYDRFPLVDGTLFLSPVKYDDAESTEESNIVRSIPAHISNKNQFIYAICLDCLYPSSNSKYPKEIKCKHCKKVWMGGLYLQIGTMYKFEIFAAFPCCDVRFNCSNCNRPVIKKPLEHFSQYSELIICPNCNLKDYHFIKKLKYLYNV